MDWENRIKTNKNKIIAVDGYNIRFIQTKIATSDAIIHKTLNDKVNPCFKLLTVSSSDACAPFADLQDTDF